MTAIRFAKGSLGAMVVLLLISATARTSDLGVPRIWTPPAVSTEGYETSTTFTPDGREMYYISASKAFTDFRILVSQTEVIGRTFTASARDQMGGRKSVVCRLVTTSSKLALHYPQKANAFCMHKPMEHALEKFSLSISKANQEKDGRRSARVES